MTTTAIIICAGDATRWENHLNTPKHLIAIEGERLLDRTVRLLQERGVREIYVVVKDITPEYHVEGAAQVRANLNPEEYHDADKFLSSIDLWNMHGRTIFLYGDVYFTDHAMDTIVGFKRQEWRLFCRPGASSVTGTPWGECFAHSFYPRHIPVLADRLRYIASLWRTGVLERCGGWELYRAMTGRKGGAITKHAMSTHYTVIDDWTEDFDYPNDYEEWLKRRALLQR